MLKTLLQRIFTGNPPIFMLLLTNTLLLITLLIRQAPTTPLSTAPLTQRIFGWEDQRPPVRSNEDFLGEKSHFTFSPDKNFIAFAQNVFDEYGEDWDKYWALKVLNLTTNEEKTLVVDDTRMSSFQWLDNQTLRLYHHAGPGVRAYFDIKMERKEPVFTKDFAGTGLWLPDTDYVTKAKDSQEAYRLYYERTSH